MKVCYILSYYSPNYIRSQTLTKALDDIEDIVLVEARNTKKGVIRYIQTLAKLLKIRLQKNPDIYILGFRGYEIYWIVRLLTIGKTLIFDHFMSPYDSLVNESKKVKQGTVSEKLIYRYEKSILKNSDLIFTDTYSHQELFSQQFSIPKEKFLPIPVSTNEEYFYPRPQKKDTDSFSVLYYSTYLPLHGVDIILEAASLLQEHPIHFTLILGRLKNLKPLLQEMRKETNITELTNVTHIPWVNYSDLPEYINRADLCLGGHYGNTGQAKRVIAGKIFQMLAMAKPMLMGQIDDDYGFVDRTNCLIVPQADAIALSQSILWGFNHQQKLREIGKCGKQFYAENFSNEVIRHQLENILKNQAQ